MFVIDDGSQPKIELSSKDRNLIAATFTHFLIKNIGGSETFKDKQDFFYHEVRKFHSNYYHEKLALKVQREKILESSMKATKNFSGKKTRNHRGRFANESSLLVSDWCGNFEVVFQGEQGKRQRVIFIIADAKPLRAFFALSLSFQASIGAA